MKTEQPDLGSGLAERRLPAADASEVCCFASVLHIDGTTLDVFHAFQRYHTIFRIEDQAFELL